MIDRMQVARNWGQLGMIEQFQVLGSILDSILDDLDPVWHRNFSHAEARSYSCALCAAHFWVPIRMDGTLDVKGELLQAVHQYRCAYAVIQNLAR